MASFLRAAGMEVVYLGTHNTADKVIAAASQEDVDAIGLSFQGGDHMHHLSGMTRLLRESGLGHIPLIAGGNIPRQDISTLKGMGVAEVFTTGKPMSAIIDYLNNMGEKPEPTV